VGPEAKIQDAIIKMLRGKEWFVINMHGNLYQAGFPDLFTSHHKYGIRLIEVKRPEMKGSRFTAAQLEVFPRLVAAGAGVWILTSATEVDYRKLFKPCNWYLYLDSYKV